MSNVPLFITIESQDLPADRLRVRKLTGSEAISQIFRFAVEVVCLDEDGPELDDVVGVELTLLFERDGLVIRRLHGMITAAEDLLDSEPAHRAYRFHVVPRAARLTFVETLDVFVGQSVPEIVEKKLGLVGLAEAFSARLAGQYEARDFVVQYKETDLAFVSRLTEHLGISFFFEQGEEEDRIVLTDQEAGFATIEEPAHFRPRGDKRDVYRLEARRQLVPGTYAVRDYNYRTPLVDITASRDIDGGFAGGVLEYGVHAKTPKEAADLAQARAEERRAAELVYEGEGDVATFTAGARVRLEGHPRLPEAGLLLVSVEHHFSQPVFDEATGGGHGYRNVFKAIPAGRTYRPARITPRPKVAGVVTAVIDPGPAGSEGAETAKIDEHGRYTVRFLFDTTAAGERRASHPIRMAQPHAGPGYGTHFPLKPGVEVIVVFVEGDPDRPIIAGAVPNPTTPSPVVSSEPMANRIRTQSGVTIAFHDG